MTKRLPLWTRITSLVCAVALCQLALVPSARAQAAYGWYGYETFGYGYMPMPVVVTPGPPLLSYENQYFDVTVRGVTRLCQTHPDLCATSPLQASLKHLQQRRVVGLSLAWTGLATAIIGPIVSTSVNCSRRDTYCRPNDWVVLGTVIGGLAMGITGLALTPESHNVMALVNDINKQTPEHPVQLKLSVNESAGIHGDKVREASVVASASF